MVTKPPHVLPLQLRIVRAVFDASVLRAPITGRIAKLFVRRGDRVAKGERIAAVEAMKMEHVLLASRAGRVEAQIGRAHV